MPEKACLEEFWAGILEVNGHVNERDPDVNGLLVTGRTVLIPKKGEAKDLVNYRPIACLNTQYKFATAVLQPTLKPMVYSQKSNKV